MVGFSIDGRDHKSGNTKSLSKTPIQAFLWGDYAADPGKTYTYTVKPLYGDVDNLKARPGVKVTIVTEDPDDGKHGVYFNRGVAGSQAYSRRFKRYRRHYLVNKFGRENWEDFIRRTAPTTCFGLQFAS